MSRIGYPEYLPPLILGVKTGRYRKDDAKVTAANTEFADVRQDVLKRDHNTCQYCGVQTQGDERSPGGGLEVHHINDDHHDNCGENLVTICPLCHAVFHLGNAARGPFKRALKIVYLPWIRQEDLNILVWTISIATFRMHCYENKQELTEGDMKNIGIGKKAEALYWVLKANSILPENAFEVEGISSGAAIKDLITSDPAALATALAGLAHENLSIYERRRKAIGNLRILYDYDKIGALVPRFSEMPLWFPGEAWAKSWEAISSNCS